MSRMARAISKVLALPWAERGLLVQAMVTLPLLTLALRFIGPRRCYLGLGRLAPLACGGAPNGTGACHRASRTGWLVRIAALRGLVRGNCLAQSLTIWWLLRRQGIPAELRIGVRKRWGRLEAHAWTEHQGRVLNDDVDIAGRYSPFDGVPDVFERRGADMP